MLLVRRDNALRGVRAGEIETYFEMLISTVAACICNANDAGAEIGVINVHQTATGSRGPFRCLYSDSVKAVTVVSPCYALLQDLQS